MPRRPSLRVQNEARGPSQLRKQIRRSSNLRHEFALDDASDETPVNGSGSAHTHKIWPKQIVPITNPADIPKEFDWGPSDLDLDEE